MVFKTVDLFAGIGGIRRGFEMTEYFKNVLSAEVDKYACETYKHLFNGDDPYNDVTSDVFKKKVQETEYDVLLGGFPCQAFSIAGKKEGFRDKTRGTLFFDVADIIDRTRPKAFLLENVEGLLRHKKGATFQVVLETLVSDLNYHVIGVVQDPTGQLVYNPKNFLLNSKNFGIPQNRPRVYIVGFDAERYGNLLADLPFTELPKARTAPPIYTDLNGLLEFNAEPGYYLARGYFETLKRHRDRHKGKGNGYGYIVVNQEGIESPVSNAILATGGSGKERNLVYDPQPAVYGIEVRGKHTPLNNEGIRFMTPREWGKLQGFINYGFLDENGDDHFSFPPGVSRIQQYKQFGNSVTIPVIEAIATRLGESLEWLETGLMAQAEVRTAVLQAAAGRAE